MGNLADRLSQPDIASLPDWEAANVLNSPDKTLPAVVEWRPTQIGIGHVLTALGANAGALLLTEIEDLSASQPVLKWGLEVLRSGNFDLSLPVARETVEGLIATKLITAEQRDQLFTFSRRERHPSWAEANDMAGKIDARAVGLARGAKP